MDGIYLGMSWKVASMTLMLFRHFDTSNALDNKKEAAKLFSVPDFVGDMCKAIASRIRGAVASVRFDDFHKVSLKVLEIYAITYAASLLVMKRILKMSFSV